MATQSSSTLFPSTASYPKAQRVDPVTICGLYPTKDLYLARPDALTVIDAFTRSTPAYRTSDQGLLQSVASNGLRIDHDPTVGTNLGALFEEVRTNFVQNSNSFTGAGWSLGSGSSVAPSNATGPDGVANSASTAVLSSSGPGLYQAVPYSASTSYYVSIWMRVASGTAQVAIMSYNSGAAGSLVQVTVTAAWQRFSVPWNGGNSNSAAQYFELRTDQVSSPANATVQIFGAQLEQGAFPTSYIPTGAGTASRGADNLSAPVTPDWYNPTEGTFYADFYSNVPLSAVNASMSIFMASDSAGNQFWVLIYPNTALVLYVVSAGQSVQTMQFGAYAGPGRYKIAVSYKGAVVSATFNGNPVTSTTFSYAPATTFSSIYVGSNNAGGAYINASISRVAYVPRAQPAETLRQMSESSVANLQLATPNRPGLMSGADKQLLSRAVISALAYGDPCNSF